MQYLCLVYHSEERLAQLSDAEYRALVAETFAYNEELAASGHFVDGNALAYVNAATTVRVGGNGQVSITDGPFVETREQLGGYVLIEARDLNEAIRIAAAMPPVRMGGGIEVRPVKDLDGPR